MKKDNSDKGLIEYNVPEDSIIPRDIEEEMRRAFIEYSMSVIIDRALPDVRDGLKPVHRRILYSMYTLGITAGSAYRKCAATVGDVLGKYHPHGDAAAYDALVRLAQDFSMRYTLVDGNGNFGSRDGDAPAAMRYTEARMSKISMEMVSDINKDTVDFRPNYDEHEVEPTVLPSRFPNLLVNGSSGIAVGMATNIPPHNLGEVIDGIVQVIDNPEITIDELMQYIKGPDFPTGANILGKQGIREAYMTGRGRILVRSQAEIEDDDNGRQRIVVTEIPYQVNNARLVERIAELVKEKRIEGISGLRDEYGKEGIRIVIELKREANANVILNQLYQYTSMQEAFNVNMLAIVPEKTEGGGTYLQPKVLNLREMLDYYIDHQKDVVTRRTKFDLKKAEDRAHILEGALIAQDNIDEVIRIIKASKQESDAKAALMERFGFTDRQAQYIVDMRLGRLTGMEREKLLAEYEEKKKEIEYYRSLLADEVKLMGVVKDELLALKNKYADDRRTRLLPYEGEIDIEDLINEQEVAITLTHVGYIKRTPAETYKAQRRGGRGIAGISTKEEDFVAQLLITSSHNRILFITNLGRVYSLKGYEIPDAGRTAKGMPVVNLLQLQEGEKVATIIPIKEFDDAKYMVIGTKSGIIKKTELSEYKNMRKGGLIAIELRDGDQLVNAELANDDDQIMLVTRKGMSIRFSQEDVRATSRASIGVKGIDLRADDYVVSVDVCREGDTALVVTEKGYGKRSPLSEYKIQSRGGKGVMTYRLSEKTGDVVGMVPVQDNHDLMLITSSGTIIRLHAADINIIGRATSGVTLMKTKEDNLIVSLGRTDREEESEENPTEETVAEGAVENSETGDNAVVSEGGESQE